MVKLNAADSNQKDFFIIIIFIPLYCEAENVKKKIKPLQEDEFKEFLLLSH
jgi:hypothetical protein